MSYQEQTTKDQTVTPTIEERLATHDLFDTAMSDPSLGRFVQWMKDSGMDPVLHGPELVTVLAVRDGAMPPGREFVDRAVDQILRGAWTESDLRMSSAVKTLKGDPVTILVEGEGARVGGARIVRADIECTNGVLHIVDGLVQR